MSPSEKVVADAIRKAVRRMFKGPERDDLTVNSVRDHVERDLHLEPGFLKTGSWKQESKNIVKSENEKLLELEEVGEELPSIQSTPAKPKSPPVKATSEPVKKGAKRSSDANNAQTAKRQKNEDIPVSENEDSSLTSVEDTYEELEDSYVSDVPRTKKPKKVAHKPEAKQQGKGGKVKEKKKSLAGVESKISGPKTNKKEVTSQVSVGNGSDAPKYKPVDSGDSEKEHKNIESDSDMSVVFGEVPKRNRKSKSDSKGRSSASTSKSKGTKQPTDLSPDEAELKILQSQLTKCGVRKIWGVILKDYGSDTKAKIRHLKGMLRDIGIEGRFSEAKAREIKEARELEADLEAVREGEAKWGMSRGSRREKGGGGKKMAEPSDEDDDDNDTSTRSRSVSEKPPARLARAKLDLAFLGDEESDSDD